MNLHLLPLLALLAAPALAQPAPYAAPDYRDAAAWLCRPGAADPCSGNASVSRVSADARVTLDILPAAKKPAIDCFYVYPTVSTDPTPNSDMIANPAEQTVAQVQAAPFRQVCRLFAPLYRQVTLAALRDRMLGKPVTADPTLGYKDVSAAFADYMKRDNNPDGKGARGVILIGHSQGSGVLKALIQNEIEGKPVARQIIAAYLAGHNVLVPAGKDVGGDLKSTPLCRSAAQTGCALAWVSFRDTMVVPPASLFGRPPAAAPAGMAVACTNPAALAGGKAVLRPLMVNRAGIVDNGAPAPKWAKGRNIYTPFVALPGLLSGECTARDDANVFSISVNADPADPRTDTINGDVVVAGQVQPAWGLHLIDMQVAMEDLVALASSQGQAWLRQR